MFSKKTIVLILTICFLSLIIVYPVQAHDFERVVGVSRGKEIKSWCDRSQENVYTCTCQGSNEVNDCHVGWLIGNPICACCGDCTLNDFLQLGTNWANIAAGFLGGTALLFFIIGGIIWITSGGSTERVQKGRKMITGAIIGIVIVLSGFMIVKVAMKALKTEEYLPRAGTDEVAAEWPECPVPPTTTRPWCYGCVWTGTGRGCQGLAVEVYQTKLEQWGYDCGSIDGKFGPDTRECTREFQAEHGLSLDDGKVGPDTWGIYSGNN